MNINCTLGCSHQRDGKCKLRETNLNNTVVGVENTECPYFENTIVKSLK